MDEILKGFFVVEGLDGAGTTTQLRLSASAISRQGLKVLTTCEPTDGPVGRLIRRILRGEEQSSAEALAYLYAADRLDHINLCIRPSLSEGSLVISDRYFFSSMAYQGLALPFERIAALNAGFPYPQAVFYVDTPVSECLKRINSRGEKKEIFEKGVTLEKVRANYERAFSLLPGDVRLVRLDGLKSAQDICDEIVSTILSLN